VLDFTRILSGPYRSLLLSDLGAEVVKAERDLNENNTRAWGSPFLDEDNGISTYFASRNRDKRSISVELTTSEGSRLFVRLLSEKDMVIENFHSGAAANLGLDTDRRNAIGPDLQSELAQGVSEVPSDSET
jgi:crotonobetainyl-CoA:carnitine CoA-transferase CaiB-like acyl-CoA transferase